ncbi:MAG: hypothetical protein IJ465_06245 [Clostridia bacterium]|nr:hypothetical protein [Clostridia bacterium]
MDNNVSLPDDLQEKLSKLLSSPESMAKISGLLGSLGGTPPPPAEAAPPPPSPPPAAGGSPEGIDIAKLLPLLSGFSGDSDDARLLRALKPYLHGERAGRLDGALRMLQLSQVLPLVSGLTGRDSHG